MHTNVLQEETPFGGHGLVALIETLSHITRLSVFGPIGCASDWIILVCFHGYRPAVCNNESRENLASGIGLQR